MRSNRAVAAIAMAAATAVVVAACGSSGSSSAGSGSNSSTSKVTITWWNNATVGTLKPVWAHVTTAFNAAHPNITIRNINIQNEQFPTKIPLALQGNNPPGVYQQWGGGQEATQVKSGKLLNLTPAVSSWISQLGSAAAGWQVNGQQYGVPFDVNSKLGWFAFPTVPGGAGDPTTVLGGGDGFSCTTSAPLAACAQFLQYLISPEVQKEVTIAGTGLPANPAAASALQGQGLKDALAANQAAGYVQTYFGIAFPTQVGQNLDNAVAGFFADRGPRSRSSGP